METLLLELELLIRELEVQPKPHLLGLEPW